MFEFNQWWWLCLLPLPFLFRLLTPRKKTQQLALTVPFSVRSLNASNLNPESPKTLSLILLWLTWIGLLLAAARPQWLDDPITLPNEGREMMIAVDLSGSMQIEDMTVNGRPANRLTMVKSVLTDFIERRTGDRLGLILFADTAYLQAPMTYDRKTVSTLLDESVIGLVGEKTAIGDAIGLAVKRFEEKGDSNNVLVLLTDGQNTAGNIQPLDAKILAVERDVKIYTIGVGADAMQVDGLFGSRRVNPSRDLDEGLLTDLAESTGGQYFRARDTQELEQIYALLDELEPVEGSGQTFRPQRSLYMYPLLAALGCLLLTGLTQLHWRRGN
ncbi:VWA domain-containing protein [Alteromonas sediminis]|uniref:VWA domain-containing protein n=1 Tax=Alteromonas sediminis TaxID=2259342 RepID=A0A3N5Y5B9_9ALTE|nr:VWA domain-containing protein [Alteromonas sediminis]RPJ68453.1 VWA domain-containing protein [Alteromonas sediminis]